MLRHGHEILLVRHSYGDRRWMLPGGRMRRGEDPVATARREMRQELGIEGGDWVRLGCLAARAGYRRRGRHEGFRRLRTHYLELRVTDRSLTPRPTELAALGWFSPDALPDDCADALDVARARGWLVPQPPDEGQGGKCSSTHSGPSTGRRYERPPTGT